MTGVTQQPTPVQRQIGAWVMHPTAEQLSMARRIGITRIDLMINDHSKDRRPTEFRCNDGVDDDAKMIRDLGFDLHFTSWVMPHQPFVAKACDVLSQLVIDHGAISVMWDAEEPWTQAIGGNTRDAAADIGRRMAGCRMGASGIGYADLHDHDPEVLYLVDVCDYVVPQVYVTSDSGLRHNSMRRVLERWSFDKPILAGLAAYAQTFDGLSTGPNMLRSWEKVRDTDGVCYWAMRHIAKNRDAQTAIEKFAKGDA